MRVIAWIALGGGIAVSSAVVPAGVRIVSVPDLHGDYERAVQILVAAGLVSEGTLRWSGGNATLIQTGDIVDRGDDAKKIYELFARLSSEAGASGGRVVNLLGNHELMNLQRDLRYVTRGDEKAFGGARERAKAWAPGGWLRALLETSFKVAVLAGGVLFVHAGLLPQLVDERRGLDGVTKDVWVAISGRESDASAERLLGDSGPLWTRHYPEDAEDAVCADASELLQRVGAMRMVVGHTIQESAGRFRVRTRCGGQVVLGDTAISRAYGGEPCYIEHDGKGSAVVVYPDSKERQVLPLPPGIVTKSATTPAASAAPATPKVRFGTAAADTTFMFSKPTAWTAKEAIAQSGRYLEEGFDDRRVVLPLVAVSFVLFGLLVLRALACSRCAPITRSVLFRRLRRQIARSG